MCYFNWIYASSSKDVNLILASHCVNTVSGKVNIFTKPQNKFIHSREKSETENRREIIK
jgi:hypothetical protein